MGKITVLLVRHGEVETDFEPLDPDQPEETELPRIAQMYRPTKMVLDCLAQRLDPELLDDGYIDGEQSFRHIGDAMRRLQKERRIAFFTSPYKSCIKTASMVAVSGFEPEEWSVWGLTTPETMKGPTAIPIVVLDGLADCTEEMYELGGPTEAIDAGLMLCAARSWNKGYKKDPIAGQVLDIKGKQRDRVREWVDAGPKNPTDYAERRVVADCQYLRLEDEENPYSLTPMTDKFNLKNELIRPNKILEPPRKGNWQSKPPPVLAQTGQKSLDKAIFLAEKCGCDFVVAVVSPEIIQGVVERAGMGEIPRPDPGIICSLIAKPRGGVKVKWAVHSIKTYDEFDENAVPPFSGPIEPTMEPPADFRKAMDEAGEEQWNQFPPPEKENTPADYPDIPPFGKCLETPVPKARWAYNNKTGPPPASILPPSASAKKK